MSNVAGRRAIEHAITKFLFEDMIRQGFRMLLSTGDAPTEECEKTPTQDVDALLTLAMNLDEVLVKFVRELVDGRHTVAGWAQLVYGNDGWDLLSDYSTRIEANLEATLAFSDRFENGRFEVVPVDGFSSPTQAMDSICDPVDTKYRDWTFTCIGGRFYPVRRDERPADPIPTDRDGDGFAPKDVTP